MDHTIHTHDAMNGNCGSDSAKTDFAAELKIAATHVQDNSVRDPVCGMTVTLGLAKPTLEYKGDSFHFCSQGCHDKFEFWVFNRWGENIFYSNDINVGWNGTYKDQLSPIGIYSWKAKYDGTKDNQVKFGEVHLMH